MKDLLTALQAVIAGIAITALIYWLLNLLIHRFPEKIKKKVEPYVFIGPVLFLIGVFHCNSDTSIDSPQLYGGRD